jgi:hypothetical protein
MYNHNWRNISTIYLYIIRLASNEIFSPWNKIHREVGWAKDLSAPQYKKGEEEEILEEGNGLRGMVSRWPHKRANFWGGGGGWQVGKCLWLAKKKCVHWEVRGLHTCQGLVFQYAQQIVNCPIFCFIVVQCSILVKYDFVKKVVLIALERPVLQHGWGLKTTFVPVYRNCFLCALNHWNAVATRVIQGGCKVIMKELKSFNFNDCHVYLLVCKCSKTPLNRCLVIHKHW